MGMPKGYKPSPQEADAVAAGMNLLFPLKPGPSGSPLGKSQMSVMSTELDEQVESFRTRPLDAGPYTFLAADALTIRVREGGRVVKVHAFVATGVNADGHREILGLDLCSGVRGRRVDVLPGPDRPRPVRGGVGDLRRPQRPRRRPRHHSARRILANGVAPITPQT